MAKPVLFDDEKPVGKIVAFKDAEELKSFNDAWLEDVNGGGGGARPAFFKMAGDEDAGAPKGGQGTGQGTGQGLGKGTGANKGPATPSAPSLSPPKTSLQPAAKPSPAGAAPSPALAPRPAATSAPRRAADDAKSAESRSESAREAPAADARKKDKGSDGDESITNNQHAEVDEGDIVKLHGEHLIVLRRGRLFTLSLDGDRPKQSKMVVAF
jgi:hypothetical protein